MYAVYGSGLHWCNMVLWNPNLTKGDRLASIHWVWEVRVLHPTLTHKAKCPLSKSRGKCVEYDSLPLHNKQSWGSIHSCSLKWVCALNGRQKARLKIDLQLFSCLEQSLYACKHFWYRCTCQENLEMCIVEEESASCNVWTLQVAWRSHFWSPH